VAGAIFRSLLAQNARYVDLSFDIVRALDRRLDIGAVVATIKAAAPPGLTARVFAAFSQHKPERTPPSVVATILDAPGLEGISLHGDETVKSTAYFADARRRGMLTKAHAGELACPDSVTKVLELLGVRRIELGVRAIENEALVERLVAEAVTLDVCPWSNVRLGVVRDLATHPIRRLHERGVRMTVSTDDPTVFGRTLTQELVSLVDDLGFGPLEIIRLQANAFAVAAMPSAACAAVLGELDALARQIAPART
jgi:adenosine deaminase